LVAKLQKILEAKEMCRDNFGRNPHVIVSGGGSDKNLSVCVEGKRKNVIFGKTIRNNDKEFLFNNEKNRLF